MADILISQYKGLPVVATYIDGSLEYLSVLHGSDVGKVYLTRVDNVVKNIEGAFVIFGQGEHGFVPTKNILPSCVVSRPINNGDEIKAGDEVILQVQNEAQKMKAAKFTSQLSVSGRYCVITLGRKGVGVSLKLDPYLREALVTDIKDFYWEFVELFSDRLFGESFGIIIRTEVADNYYPDQDNTDFLEVIRSDIKDNIEKLAEILQNGRLRTVFTCLMGTDVDETDTHITKAKNFLRKRGIKDVNVITESVVHSVANDINKLGNSRVWLKSGAFIIIEQLESFNAIDVNSGKAVTGKKDIAEKVNEEAAVEIMRQIRLRNLTGMILIDFINMKKKDENTALCDRVKELCEKEDVRTEFIDLTGLGIVELTRNKNDKSLKEILENIPEPVDKDLDE